MPVIVSGSDSIFEGKKKPSASNKKGFRPFNDRVKSVTGFAKEAAMRRVMKIYRATYG